jgi:hypothetical protein
MKNFLALLVFAGGFAGWYLYHQKQEVEESLAATQKQSEIHEKEAAIKRAEFQALNSVMAIRKKAAEKQAELILLRNQLKTLRDAKDAVARDRQQTLAAIRQTFAGKTIPLKLNNGRDLGQVRIMKADDTGVTVALPSGVQKVPPQELPQDLKQALNY